MKRILNVSLFLSILACLFYGLDGIFNLDLIASLSLRAPQRRGDFKSDLCRLRNDQYFMVLRRRSLKVI